MYASFNLKVNNVLMLCNSLFKRKLKTVSYFQVNILSICTIKKKQLVTQTKFKYLPYFYCDKLK